MMKPKVYLKSIGAITEIKRGRLSREHIELCKQGAAKGAKIEGYSVSNAPTRNVNAGGSETPPAPNAETVVTKTPVNTSQQVIEPFYRYGENGVEEFVAVENDGTKHDLRQACICGYSLSGHLCETPMILVKGKRGHQPVTIVRK